MLQDAIPLERCARALVVKLRHHGDVLLAAPVLRALREAAPGLEIDALVYDDTAPMLAGHPALAQLHVVGRAWRRLGPRARLAAEIALMRRLRQRAYDVLVHLSDHPRGAWLARLLGPRYAVAPAVGHRGRFWRRSFTHRFSLPRNARRHMVEWNLDAVRRMGVEIGDASRRVEFVPGPEAERSIETRLDRLGLASGGFVHLHPASRWSFKCWPAARNAALVRRLVEDGLPVVVTAAPDATETAFVREIVGAAGAKRCIDLAGVLSVRELGALVRRALVFVGVDSMPMHLAAAMGTPVVALFGPSGEHEWGPWGCAHRVVTTSHPCRPCGNDGCGGSKVSDCLTELGVDVVYGAASALIHQRRHP